MADAKFKIEITFKSGKRELHELEKNSIIIGRGSKADITAVEEGVSRDHLLIESDGGKVYLTDLGSSNGSQIGDEALAAQERTEFDTFFMPINCGPHLKVLILEYTP